MADALADLGSPVDDQILILHILCGLNQRFEHVGAIIRHYSSFLNFLKVWDDLVLEEILLDTSDPAAAPTALYSNSASSVSKPQPSALPRPPSNGNGNDSNNNHNKNNNHRNNSNGGNNNNNNDGGHGSNAGSTTVASSGFTNSNNKSTPP
jgi:hypothetical protein